MYVVESRKRLYALLALGRLKKEKIMSVELVSNLNAALEVAKAEQERYNGLVKSLQDLLTPLQAELQKAAASVSTNETAPQNPAPAQAPAVQPAPAPEPSQAPAAPAPEAPVPPPASSEPVSVVPQPTPEVPVVENANSAPSGPVPSGPAPAAETSPNLNPFLR